MTIIPQPFDHESRCYHPGVSFVLLYIVVGIVVFYLVAGVLRWLRQKFQPPRDRDADKRE